MYPLLKHIIWDQQIQSKLHAVHPKLRLWPHSSPGASMRQTHSLSPPHRTYVPDTPALTCLEILHQSVSLVRNVCPWSTS